MRQKRVPLNFTFGINRMKYTNNDLCVFVPLFDPAKKEGTAYIEFHPKELPRQNACWFPGSLLLRDAAFDFYTECFHAASESFDYFSFMRFDQGKIERLSTELSSYLRALKAQPDREHLFSKYASLFKPDIWSEVDTPSLVSAVHETGDTLLAFIKTETKESKCLWVLGM